MPTPPPALQALPLGWQDKGHTLSQARGHRGAAHPDRLVLGVQRHLSAGCNGGGRRVALADVWGVDPAGVGRLGGGRTEVREEVVATWRTKVVRHDKSWRDAAQWPLPTFPS